MSWNITKKLKGAHLNPLSNTFSRSPSTVITTSEKDEKARLVGSSSPAPNDNGRGTHGEASSLSESEQIFPAASEFMGKPPPAQPRPGFLVVTLHEGQGFSLPDQYQNAFSTQQQSLSPQDNKFEVTGSIQTSTGGFNTVPTNHGRISPKYLPYALLDFDKLQVFANAVAGSLESPFWAGENSQYKFDVSRATELAVHLYVRNPNAPPGSGRSQDIFLGVTRINPLFEEAHEYAKGSKLNKKDKEKALGQSGIEWLDVTYGTGKIRIGVQYIENRTQSLKLEDFELLKVVGRGSFGMVTQVKKKDTQRIYALKTIRKSHIISRSEVAHTLAERSVLSQINNPFIVPLKFTFQSPEKLYIVLAFVNGGELFYHLQQEQRFDINRSRFYIAELLCALEYLHGCNIIYRDLKPENILLDYSGHIALCDFGLCKLDMKDEVRTNTFCGTPEYLAPEILLGQGYTKTVDWWTLGVLLYEMLTGLPPFYDENTTEMYRKILAEPLHFPGPEIIPLSAKDLLTTLLDRNPEQRLGAQGASEIKAHHFFHSIDWRKLLQRKYEPTFKPNVSDALSTEQFYKGFNEEIPRDSHDSGSKLSQTMQEVFTGWSYNRPVAGLGDIGSSIRDPSFIGSVENNR